MLKVTFCAFDKPDNVGGPPAWLQRLLPDLQAHGIEVRCLFLLHCGDTGPSVEFLTARGIDCRSVREHDSMADRVHWILDQLRDNPPDILVANYVLPAYYAGRWCQQAGIPVVGVMHSDDPFYRALQDLFVFGREENRVSGLVCVSDELVRLVSLRQPRSRIAKIAYGSPFPDAAVVRKPGVLRLAYVGRLANEQKQIAALTHAFCRVVKEIGDTEAVIYGDGPDRDSVLQILAAEGAGQPVRYGGLIDSKQILDTLMNVDILVLLSDYEGLPIALMEAMACGCVPVCLRTRSGIPELIEHGVTGLIVEDRGDDFLAAIRRLREDEGLWARLSAGARERIRTDYSHDVGTRRWAQFLKEIQSAAGKKRAVRFPRRIPLPPVHPDLRGCDPRPQKVAPPVKWWRSGRKFAGKMRRKWFKSGKR